MNNSTVGGVPISCDLRMFDDFAGFVFAVDVDENIIFSNKYFNDIFGSELSESGFGMLSRKYFQQRKLFSVSVRDDSEKCETGISNICYRCVETDTKWLDGRPCRLYIGIDVTDISNSAESYMISASTDSMTGIYNRHAGIDCLKKYIKYVQNGEKIFTVSYFDINDLKYVNDNFGHAAGDEYILNVVSVIKNTIRHTDFFSRMGGDEFLIIFPNCRYGVVTDIMDTVAKRLNLLSETRNPGYVLSVSYGIMEVNTETNLDIEHILNTVDHKMYYMKEEYRRTRR